MRSQIDIYGFSFRKTEIDGVGSAKFCSILPRKRCSGDRFTVSRVEPDQLPEFLTPRRTSLGLRFLPQTGHLIRHLRLCRTIVVDGVHSSLERSPMCSGSHSVVGIGPRENHS